jgi:hypothetical protein
METDLQRTKTIIEAELGDILRHRVTRLRLGKILLGKRFLLFRWMRQLRLLARAEKKLGK